MKFLYLIFLVFCYLSSVSQELSSVADLVARSYLKHVSSKSTAKIFSEMLERRADLHVNERVDTTDYQYLYIEERFNPKDSSMSAVEYYFRAREKATYEFYYGDPTRMPYLLYQNDSLLDHARAYFSSATAGVIHGDIYEYFYTLDTILHRCETLKPLQECSFDPTVAVFNFLVNGGSQATPEWLAEQAKQKETETKDYYASNYQMVTLIDRESGKVIVSLQNPVRDPKVKVRVVDYHYSDW